MEIIFELDPLEIIKEFCHKFKILDAETWVVDFRIGKTFFDKTFFAEITTDYQELEIVWNSNKLTVRRMFGIIEGAYAEIFHFLYGNLRILRLYRLSDYGMNFNQWKDSFQRFKFEVDISLKCIYNEIYFRIGKFVLSEFFL